MLSSQASQAGKGERERRCQLRAHGTRTAVEPKGLGCSAAAPRMMEWPLIVYTLEPGKCVGNRMRIERLLAAE